MDELNPSRNPYVAWLVEAGGAPDAATARALAALHSIAARLAAEARAAAPALVTALGGGDAQVLEPLALALLADAAAEAVAEAVHDRGRGALLAGALRWQVLGRGAPPAPPDPDPTRAFAARVAAQSHAHAPDTLHALAQQGAALRHRARAIVTEALVPGFHAAPEARPAAPARAPGVALARRLRDTRVAIAVLATVAVLTVALALLEAQRERAWQAAAGEIDSLAALADAEADTLDVIFDRPAENDAEYRDDLRQGLHCLDRLDRTLAQLRPRADRALATSLARGRERTRLVAERGIADLRAGQSRARRREAELTLRFPGRHRPTGELDLEQRMLESDVDALEAQATRIERSVP